MKQLWKPYPCWNLMSIIKCFTNGKHSVLLPKEWVNCPTLSNLGMASDLFDQWNRSRMWTMSPPGSHLRAKFSFLCLGYDRSMCQDAASIDLGPWMTIWAQAIVTYYEHVSKKSVFSCSDFGRLVCYHSISKHPDHIHSPTVCSSCPKPRNLLGLCSGYL